MCAWSNRNSYENVISYIRKWLNFFLIRLNLDSKRRSRTHQKIRKAGKNPDDDHFLEAVGALYDRWAFLYLNQSKMKYQFLLNSQSYKRFYYTLIFLIRFLFNQIQTHEHTSQIVLQTWIDQIWQNLSWKSLYVYFKSKFIDKINKGFVKSNS